MISIMNRLRASKKSVTLQNGFNYTGCENYCRVHQIVAKIEFLGLD